MEPPLGSIMESEIISQPRRLAENVERYAGEASCIVESVPKMFLAFARGSSDNAALYLRYLAEVHLGVPVVLGAPSVWTVYRRHVAYPPSLAVGISQSGEGPDIIEVIAALKAQGHQTLAITNHPDSTLAATAASTMALGVGPELAVAATKTYSSSLAILYQLIATWAADLSTLAASQFDSSWWAACRLAAENAVDSVDRAQIVVVLGRGYSYATAHETALKLMECALVPAKAYSRADFEHGPKALLGPRTAVIVFGEVPASVEASESAVIRAPAYPQPEAAPIFEIAFGQWLALLVARKRGLDADRPAGLSKVTKTR